MSFVTTKIFLKGVALRDFIANFVFVAELIYVDGAFFTNDIRYITINTKEYEGNKIRKFQMLHRSFCIF